MTEDQTRHVRSIKEQNVKSRYNIQSQPRNSKSSVYSRKGENSPGLLRGVTCDVDFGWKCFPPTLEHFIAHALFSCSDHACTMAVDQSNAPLSLSHDPRRNLAESPPKQKQRRERETSSGCLIKIFFFFFFKANLLAKTLLKPCMCWVTSPRRNTPVHREI